MTRNCRKLAIAAVAASCASVAGCGGSEWPPYKTHFQSHYTANTNTLETLAHKIRQSNYCEVSTTIEGRARGYSCTDEPQVRSLIDNDDAWHTLLTDIGMHSVSRTDSGSVWLSLGGGVFERYENRQGWASYLNSVEFDRQLINCAPEHRKVACGDCVFDLGNDWYVHYSWSPNVYDDEAYDAYVNGDLPFETYRQSRNMAQNHCIEEGRQAIGNN